MLRTLIDLFLLRGRPQDLPAARGLVLGAAALALVIDAVVEVSYSDQPNGALLALIQVGIYGLVVYAALVLSGVPERWMQTLTALYSINAILSLLAWPAYGALFQQAGQIEFGWELAYLLVLSLWSLTITAQVFRHALDASLGRALLVTVVCMMTVWILMLFVVSAVQPPLPPPGAGEGG